MSGSYKIDRVEAASKTFAAHHSVDMPRPGATLRLGAEVGRGGFATVFAVDDIDGQALSTPLLAKVFDHGAVGFVPGGAQRIADGTNDLIARLEGRQDYRWCEELLALPFCVAFGGWKGRSALVAMMLDLRARGYEQSPLGDTDAMSCYLALPLEERQELAGSFARKATLLEEVGLIHGDLNGQNLLLRYSPPDVQVIDVDAGVLVKRGDERPLTPGKADGLMPPEVKQPSAPGQIDMTAYTPASERWSVGCLVGYLLFGAHPAFFLDEISATSIRAYASTRPGWPVIDVRSPLFTTTPQNRTAYPVMRVLFESVPDEVSVAFRQLFAAGLDAHQRPSADAWAHALAVMCSPPLFADLGLDSLCVVDGMPVTLSWRAQGATSVEIRVVDSGGGVRTLGAFAAAGSLPIPLDRRAGFLLIARNAYGEATESAGPVRVLPRPHFDRYRPPRPVLHPLQPGWRSPITPVLYPCSRPGDH